MTEKSDNHELNAAFLLGEQTKTFLRSEVGRYLNGSMQQDMEAAKEELLEIDPYKYDKLVNLQNAIVAIQRKALSAKKLSEYLAEAIVNGNQAGLMLDAGDEGDNGE